MLETTYLCKLCGRPLLMMVDPLEGELYWCQHCDENQCMACLMGAPHDA